MTLKEMQAAKVELEAAIEKARQAEKPPLPKERVKLFVRRDGDFFYFYSLLQNEEEMRAAQERQFEVCGRSDPIPERVKGMNFVLSRSGRLVSTGGGWFILKTRRVGFDNIIDLTPAQIAQIDAEIFPRELFSNELWQAVVD